MDTKDEILNQSADTSLGRKNFIKWMAGGIALGLAGQALASSPKSISQGKPLKSSLPKKNKWGMAIDMDLCTGCGSCVVACHVENNVPFNGNNPDHHGTEINWMTLLQMDADGDSVNTPIPCMHCENAPCVKVCPVNATYITSDGIVDQVWDRCIGCRYCENACPYSRRYFNWKEPSAPVTYQQSYNPDVATRPEGIIEKCTFCIHRVRKLKEDIRAEDREMTDADVCLLPACAQACPAEAITFGDLNDPQSKVSELARNPRSSRLLEHIGTEPKVFYLAKRIGNPLDQTQDMKS